MVDALEACIREYVVAQMPADPSGELGQMSLSDLLITYATWFRRTLPARPRNAHVSAELQANLRLSHHQMAFGALVKAIEDGADLTPHLSRAVGVALVPTAQQAEKHRRKDRDLLIADWGIHHLHLSTTVESDGFATRTSDLLFAFFTPDDAYLINIYPHGSWALKQMLEICVRNWPDSRVLTKIHGVLGLDQEYSDEDRLQLRNAGVASLVVVDGSVYMTSGQTTAGTPLDATIRANAVLWKLRELREHEDLLALINSAAGANAGADQWQPEVCQGVYGFSRKGVLVGFGSLE